MRLSINAKKLREARRPRETQGSKAFAAWVASTGATQRDVAETVGTTTQMVQSWMRGRHTPSLCIAVRIRDVAGIPLDAWVQRPAEEGGQQ
jgi:transcriptional regulator with XRE-family HTH domain